MKETTGEKIAKAAGYLAAVPLLFLLWGWATSMLWGWFVVPLGVAAIGVWHGAGIWLCAGFLRHRGAKTGDVTAVDWANYIIAPLVAVGMGWLIQRFGMGA